YKNPLFRSICTADLADGSQLPLSPEFQTYNRREILLPAAVTGVTLTESFNPGWKYTLDGENWLPVKSSALLGMRIDLETPTRGETTRLRLQYHPAFQPYYRSALSLTAGALLGFSWIRSRRMKRIRQA
ncbi:MAG TPA: hypothetical protein VF258_06920, partial [Luteolibacter sp.]